jgi:hypothetical protein
MNNQKKLENFLTIATLLNKNLESKPILYGSLGLSFALNLELKTDDIDVLIEEHIFKKNLDDVRYLLSTLGFVLTDPHENEFRKDAFKIGMSHDGDMLSFSGVNPNTLPILNNGAIFRVLTPEDYLKTYRASRLDGYRRDKRQKNDDAKIKLITTWFQENAIS